MIKAIPQKSSKQKIMKHAEIIGIDKSPYLFYSAILHGDKKEAYKMYLNHINDLNKKLSHITGKTKSRVQKALEESPFPQFKNDNKIVNSIIRHNKQQYHYTFTIRFQYSYKRIVQTGFVKEFVTETITDQTLQDMYDYYKSINTDPSSFFHEISDTSFHMLRPIYSTDKMSNWAEKIAKHYLLFKYYDCFFEKLVRKDTHLTRIKKSTVYNKVPLFDNTNNRKYCQRIFEDIKFNAMYNNMTKEITCVLQALLNLKDNSHCRCKKMIDDFVDENRNEGVSIDHLLDFVKKTNNISLYVFDPFQELINFYVPPPECRSVPLVLLMDDNHTIQIGDTHLISQIAKNPHVGEKLLKDKVYEICYDDMVLCEKDSDPLSYNNKVVLIDKGTSNDLCDLAHRVTTDTKCKVENIIFHNNGSLRSFQHPVTEQIFEITSDYNERKETCEQLSKIIYSADFEWKNQSFTQLAMSIYDNMFGNVNSFNSNLRTCHFDLLIESPCAPLVQKGNFGNNNSITFDTVRAYASYMLKNTEPYNVFSEYAEMEYCTLKSVDEMVPGEYFISFDFQLPIGHVVSKGFYPMSFVKQAVVREWISLEAITMVLKADYTLDPQVFKGFIEFVYSEENNLSELARKNLVNLFLGQLGQRWYRKKQAITSTDPEIVASFYNKNEENENTKCSVNKFEDLYFLSRTTKTKKTKTSLPVERQIICQGWLTLCDMYEKIAVPGSSCYYNTDSITFKKENVKEKFQPDFTNDMKKTIDNIGKIQLEYKTYEKMQKKPEKKAKKVNEKKVYDKLQCSSCFVKIANNDRKRLEMTIPKWIQCNENMTVEKLINMKSAKISGAPGCGKTALLCELSKYFSDQRTIILSMSNKVVDNLKNRLPSQHCNNVHTFDSYFETMNGSGESLNKSNHIQHILVDEYSQCTPFHFKILYDLKKKNNNVSIYLFGDQNQCLSVVNNNGSMYNRQYDYDNSSLINVLCNNHHITLKYNEATGRCSPELRNVLDTLLTTGKLVFPESFTGSFKSKAITNITMTNKKIKETNKQFVPDNIISTGHHVICNENLKEHNVFNSQFYTVLNIDEEEVALKMDNEEEQYRSVPVAIFNKHFSLNYSTTVYKYQGTTVFSDFNILDFKQFTKRTMYTALSRAKSLQQIGFDIPLSDLKDFVFREDSFATTATKLKFSKVSEENEKYKNGKIYKILDSSDNIIYMGQTIRSIKQEFNDLCRFNNEAREKKEKRPIREYLKDNKESCKVELVKNFPCKSLLELTAEETKQINVHASEHLLNVRQRKRKTIEVTKIDMNIVSTKKKIKLYHDPANKRFKIYRKDIGNKYFSYAKTNANEALQKLYENYEKSDIEKCF